MKAIVSKTTINVLKPVLVLFILAPIVAELLSGSTPASRSPQLLFESLYYGSAALLIREFVRRQNLGWLSIIVLGIGFGIIGECIILQPVFNTKFFGNDITYGRLWGVNWIWALCMICYDAVWGISIPIYVTEILFAKHRTQPWIGNFGISLASVIYILSFIASFAIFKKLSGFAASPHLIVISTIIAIVVIIVAFRIPAELSSKNVFRKSPPFIAGIISFTASIIWFGILSLIFRPNSGIHPLIAGIGGVILVAVVFYLIINWPIENWGNRNQFFLASGCLFASMTWGFITLLQSGNVLDYVSQIVFIILTSLALIVVYKRLIGQ